MSTEFILVLDDRRASLARVGGKGASLAKLARAGLPVPDGFFVTTDAYSEFVLANGLQPSILEALEGTTTDKPETLETASRRISELFLQSTVPVEIAERVMRTYRHLPGDNPAVAVRSSATAEDLPDMSFAGQQETFLNISGEEAVLDAVRKCWASLWTARAIGYRIRNGIDQQAVSLSVVVQLLVDAKVSGIMFTANPLNGHRGQAMITATWGLGEAIVGGMVTPDTLVVDREKGEVVSRETPGKHTMTVRVNGGTEEKPVPADLRLAPVIDDQTAVELAKIGDQIEAMYGMPMDIEWTLDGDGIAIVQARPITALPEPEAVHPSEWALPNPKGRYMHVSICELMPDPLSPLFETMGLPSIVRGVEQMCRDIFKLPDEVLDGFLVTINGYAYEAIDFTARQWWLLLSRMVPRFPQSLRIGLPYWEDNVLPQYQAMTAKWAGRDISRMAPDELLAGAKELSDAFGFHLASLMISTMGPTAGTEGVFTAVYTKFARRSDDDPLAPVFLMGFDNKPIMGEKALYDIAEWVRGDDGLAAYIRENSGSKIHAALGNGAAPVWVDEAAWEIFQARFADYLADYGYAIFNLDFKNPLPMDEPAAIIETLRMFVNGQGKNPHERQQAAQRLREESTVEMRGRLRGLKLWLFDKTLAMAQKRAPRREDGLATIGLAYPYLRRMLNTLGGHLAACGVIHESADIFWLTGSELEQAVGALMHGAVPLAYVGQVKERKAVWQGRKKVGPPPQLPLDSSQKFIGIDVDMYLHADESSQAEHELKGIGVSPGSVTAEARVLHGPEDFDQMRPGDILVAGITTPAWTPLFAMASAVVTDVGGPLSHSSIVAREYGIPAVLGTGIATRRIESGQVITVDGSAGIVTMSENGDQL